MGLATNPGDLTLTTFNVALLLLPFGFFGQT
jgi:hypothetical protein